MESVANCQMYALEQLACMFDCQNTDQLGLQKFNYKNMTYCTVDLVNSPGENWV